MISKYRLTHLFVNFLVPTESGKKFRRELTKLGFMKFDVNTYFRPTAPGKVDEIMVKIEKTTPYASTVRVMRITDKQWTDAKVLIGKDK